MAKFFKSIFNTTDRRKAQYEGEGEEEKSEPHQVPHTRRQLSISRSGRMRQANKKRHSLTLELYGDSMQIDSVEKPKSVEYHVNSPTNKTAPAALGGKDRLQDNPDTEGIAQDTFQVSLEKKLSALAVDSGAKSPEEEIDNAFEIIDKS